MEPKSSRKDTRRPAVGGFSLVELLTVVAIIVLLIGILVPAVNKVREKAREAATQSAIGTLSTGLETFRADQQLSGGYPPSASDYERNGKLQYSAVPPRSTGGAPPEQITGAGLLVWALAGADQLGTPGFRTFRSGTQYWGLDTDSAYYANDLSDCGAYALDDNRQPVRSRVGPLVDLSKVQLTPPKPDTIYYQIDAEIEACEALGIQPPNRRYPMFLDAFGSPIMYWRADPAGVQIADRTPNDVSSNPAARGMYHFLDNGMLLAEGGYLGSVPGGIHQDPLQLRADRTDNPHNLIWDDTDLTLPEERQFGFAGYIRNTSVSAKVTPFKVDSFLLISPGVDRTYGTGDDLANFEHNGAELTRPQ